MSDAVPSLASFPVELVVRGALLLLIAHAATWLLRRGPASRREIIWTAAFVALLVLPVTGSVGPAFELPAEWMPQPVESVVVSGSAWARRSPAGSMPTGTDVATSRRSSQPRATASRPPLARTYLPGVWLAGTVLFLTIVGIRHLRAAVLRRTSKPVTHRGWKRDLSAVADRLELARSVELRTSDRVRVPTVCGVIESCLLIPPDAGAWSAHRRRIVLLHELAHVGRRDVLAQLVSDVVCALHWPNPLVWVARARISVVREQVCDDRVLESGVTARDYGREIVAFARRLPGGLRPAAAGESIARRSSLERRLRAILDGDRSRNVPRAPVRLSLVVSLAVATWPLAAGTVAAPTVPVDVSEPTRSEGVATDTDARSPTLYYRGSVNQDTLSLRVWLDRLAGASDPEVRERAAWVLGEFGVATAERPLQDALDDPAPGVRSQAAWALGELRLISAGRRLIRALGDPVPEVRRQAAWALGEVRARASVSRLIDALGDPEATVREQAAWALGEIGDPSAQDALGRVESGDNEPSVRRTAAWALQETQGL